MDAFIGTVFGFAFDFQPADGWITCDGRSLNISDYQDLYMIIQENFGGDGHSTFNVPDLKSRVPVGFGPDLAIGSWGGTERLTLTPQNLPTHTHAVTPISMPANSVASDIDSPVDAYLSVNSNTTGNAFVTDVKPEEIVNMAVNRQTSSMIGGSNPIDMMGPYQAINYCICYKGMFPPRPR